MNVIKAAALAHENPSDPHQTSLHDAPNMTTPMAQLQIVEAPASTEIPDGQEAYERGMALKNVGLFR
jgi:hypothetical protein